MNDQNQDLKMTFDPMTIEHLGVRMYSTLPPVLAELIANSADADASHVTIRLDDLKKEKEIIVEDNGDGMSLADLNEKFLRIGRNRREEEKKDVTIKGRKVIGKKGLGKLSFFGIAGEIEVMTRKDGLKNMFVMRWEDIKRAGQEHKDYVPTLLQKEVTCDPKDHGTTITLRDVQREGGFTPKNLAISLSKIFIVDPAFTISIEHNSDDPVPVENSQKYEGLDREVEWDVPADIGDAVEYLRKNGIAGHLIATKKPIPPNTNMRGITLFSRKKLVNNPEYFSDSMSSHFYSYLTGWLEVDFIDDLPEDVIATDRQSLNWGYPAMAELRDNLRAILNWLERNWRTKRESERRKKITEVTGINTDEWFSKLPEDVRRDVEGVVKELVSDSELASEVTATAVRRIHTLVPEFPRYHWRHLHPKVQQVSKIYYENKDYYTAFLEAAKTYADAVRAKSGVTQPNDGPTMEEAFKFNPPGPILSVTDGYKKSDGTDFPERTLSNIRRAHHLFSVGVICGGRNVVDHTQIEELRNTGLFTESDCLDALSLLSHLFWRLDHSVKVR
ncbi:MAG: TIGR02391 family protein [bacterium]|nr:TIGR02391 family protein [bacterium]